LHRISTKISSIGTCLTQSITGYGGTEALERP
jgi:hypothetical protein